MSHHSELIIVMKNHKTGKEIKQLLKSVPRVGEAIVPDEKTLWRVTDIIWHNHWGKSGRVYHEVTLYVKKESK